MADRLCRVGFIGCGALMNRQHIQNAHHSEMLQVHTLCDIKEEALESTAAKFPPVRKTADYTELLADADVDLVVIAMRPEFHAKFAVESLRAGKPVYVEKPLGETIEKTREVAAVAAETGLPVAVGFNRRFAPAYNDVKPLLADRVGEPVVFYRIADREIGRRAGNPRLLEEVCHIYDILTWLTDSDPVRVYATEGSHHNDNIVTLSFESGATATILSTGKASLENPKEHLEVFWDNRSAFVEDFIEARYFRLPGMPPLKHYAGRTDVNTPAEVSASFGEPGGLEACLKVKRRFNAEWDKMEAGEPYDKAVTAMPVNYVMDKGWQIALEEMGTAVLEGRSPRNANALDGVRATAVALAAQESVAKGLPVDLDASVWLT